MSSNEIHKFTGWIDSRRRPLLNLRVYHAVARRDLIVCAVVDTGFNGYLLWELGTGNLSEFPGELSPLYESVEVAGGTILVAVAATHIQWFGTEGVYTPIEALVSLTPKGRVSRDPIVFVGTALMSGGTLVVDFLNATLRIEQTQ